MILATTRCPATGLTKLPRTADTPPDAGARWVSVPHYTLADTLVAALHAAGWGVHSPLACLMHNKNIMAAGWTLSDAHCPPPDGYTWGMAITWANDRRHRAKLYGGLITRGSGVGIPLCRLGADYPSTTLTRLCKYGWDLDDHHPLRNLGDDLKAAAAWMDTTKLLQRPRDYLIKAAEAKLLSWDRIPAVVNMSGTGTTRGLYVAFCTKNAASPPDLQMERALSFLSVLQGKKAA